MNSLPNDTVWSTCAVNHAHMMVAANVLSASLSSKHSKKLQQQRLASLLSKPSSSSKKLQKQQTCLVCKCCSRRFHFSYFILDAKSLAGAVAFFARYIDKAIDLRTTVADNIYLRDPGPSVVARLPIRNPDELLRDPADNFVTNDTIVYFHDKREYDDLFANADDTCIGFTLANKM